MKKIINKPEDLVIEMLQGLVYANPNLKLNHKFKIISKKTIDANKVTLISGGGSGHEPAHAGFVGEGLLDVAVCGDVFASPSQIQVYQGIKEAQSQKGTLLIIKNYSGDIMNFKNAAHLAQEDGINVDFVIVDDDIAVKDSLYTVGNRGVAGCVLVHKVAGAAAALGYDLQAVKKVAQKANHNTKSIGFALNSCTVPAKGTPTFTLKEDEIEYGVGIHGEPGIKAMKIEPSLTLAQNLIDDLLNSLSLNIEDEFIVLVNGFGATPLQELYALNNDAINYLVELNLKPTYTLVGNYMTSIDMAGASISIMKLDDELKKLLNENCSSLGLSLNGFTKLSPFPKDVTIDTNNYSYNLETNPDYALLKNNQLSLNNLIYIVDKMADIIIKNEIPFCELDAHAGDGDFGMSVAKGFKQLKKEWTYLINEKSKDIGTFFDACSIIIMEHCGGASGPIWGSAFRSVGKTCLNKENLSIEEFAVVLSNMVEAIQSTGQRSFGRGAVIGDKTLIDALAPCANYWLKLNNQENIKEAFTNGALAAVAGAKKTETFAAKMGRAGTVGDRSIGYPDAGAFALGLIFTEVADSLK